MADCNRIGLGLDSDMADKFFARALNKVNTKLALIVQQRFAHPRTLLLCPSFLPLMLFEVPTGCTPSVARLDLAPP